jgi:hypothetical protein
VAARRRSLLLNGSRNRRWREVEEVEDESVWMNGLDLVSCKYRFRKVPEVEGHDRLRTSPDGRR